VDLGSFNRTITSKDVRNRIESVARCRVPGWKLYNTFPCLANDVFAVVNKYLHYSEVTSSRKLIHTLTILR
jgi:hypothetical protein